MSLRIIAIIAIMLMLPGCSLLFVDGPPRIRPGAPIPATADCTTSYAMPIVDVIFGVASILAISELLEDEDVAASGKVAIFAYPVGLFGSGFQGIRRIQACEDFLNTHFDPGAGPWLREDRAPGWMFERGNGLERYFQIRDGGDGEDIPVPVRKRRTSG